MTLATADARGMPHARIVLLKQADARGFCFFTNTGSEKGRELAQNPHAALCFYWMPLDRQIRVEGIVKSVTDEEADAYFQSRHPESQLGAWASEQSGVLDSRDTLMERLRAARERYGATEVPRPPYWSGYRLAPSSIEFWEAGEYRLHHRERFTRSGQGAWSSELLYP